LIETLRSTDKAIVRESRVAPGARSKMRTSQRPLSRWSRLMQEASMRVCFLPAMRNCCESALRGC